MSLSTCPEFQPHPYFPLSTLTHTLTVTSLSSNHTFLLVTWLYPFRFHFPVPSLLQSHSHQPLRLPSPLCRPIFWEERCLESPRHAEAACHL